jgi:hypothetical protein
MGQNFFIRDEVDYLLQAAILCRDARPGHDGVWQVAPFFGSVPYSAGYEERLGQLKATLVSKFPELVAYGEKRANRAFSQLKDSVTKPSYINRIRNFCDRDIDQVRNITAIASRERYSSGLVFSVFDPGDLIDRRRPGYVPCIISGTVLLAGNELQLNAFFRSQSVIEMGLFDLLFLRRFQSEFVSAFRGLRSDLSQVECGHLNIFCSRVFIHRRLVKRNNNFLSRSDVVDDWISAVEMFALQRV